MSICVFPKIIQHRSNKCSCCISHLCLIVMATRTEWYLTDLQTNHFLVPVCQWFVSCVGVAAWEKWHGSCCNATEWYAYVFASPWSLLAWSNGATDLPRRHEWFWCPCSHHLTNRIIYWRHGVFLWFCITQVLNRPVILSFWAYALWKCGEMSWQHTSNKLNLSTEANWHISVDCLPLWILCHNLENASID